MQAIISISNITCHPKGPKTGDARVIRGGSWDPRDRPPLRPPPLDGPTEHSNDFGFRLARI